MRAARAAGAMLVKSILNENLLLGCLIGSEIVCSSVFELEVRRSRKEKDKKPAKFIAEIGVVNVFRLTDTRKTYHHLQIAWLRDMG